MRGTGNALIGKMADIVMSPATKTRMNRCDLPDLQPYYRYSDRGALLGSYSELGSAVWRGRRNDLECIYQ